MPVRREQVAAALKYLGDKADLRGRFERATSLDPQEQDLADIAVETAAGFVPGVGQALAARDVERARRANDPAGMAMAAASAVPGGKLAGLLKRYDPTRLELDVYHGTPHRFPATEANPLGEFDASKIGTGEGAQAYGHGIYLAESPGVAESYKQMAPQMLPVGKYAPNEESAYYAARVVRQMGSPEKAIEKLAGTGKSQEFVKAIKDGSYKRFYDELPQASLYKADLPDEMIDRMLDWDKPINQQSAAIQGALKFEVVKDPEFAQGLSDSKWLLKLNNKVINGYDTRKEAIMSANESTAGQIFNTMNQVQSPSKVAEFYKNAGIPGIKYLDAGSRGQGGSGTRNFVVFPGEEKKVRILERK